VGRPTGAVEASWNPMKGLRWTVIMDDLHQWPTRFQAPQPKRAELDAIAEAWKDAIVVARCWQP
jgi:hypothetical protein